MDHYLGMSKKELRASWYHQIVNQLFCRETARIILSVLRNQQTSMFVRENFYYHLISGINHFYSEMIKNPPDSPMKEFFGVNGLKLFAFSYKRIPKDTQNFEKLSTRRDCLDELVKFCYVCGIIKSIPHYIFDKEQMRTINDLKKQYSLLGEQKIISDTLATVNSQEKQQIVCSVDTPQKNVFANIKQDSLQDEHATIPTQTIVSSQITTTDQNKSSQGNNGRNTNVLDTSSQEVVSMDEGSLAPLTDRKEQATFYFYPAQLDDLEEVRLKIKKVFGRTINGKPIDKSLLMRTILHEVITDFQKNPQDSMLVQWLTKRLSTTETKKF